MMSDRIVRRTHHGAVKKGNLCTGHANNSGQSAYNLGEVRRKIDGRERRKLNMEEKERCT